MGWTDFEDIAGILGDYKLEAVDFANDRERELSSLHRPRYTQHRGVDDDYGVITAQVTTPGDIEGNIQLAAEYF